VLARTSAGLQVEIEDFFDRLTDRESSRDDPAGAGAGDIVEIVGEDKICAPALRLEQILDPLQHFECQHPADAAAIDREQLLGAFLLDPRY